MTRAIHMLAASALLAAPTFAIAQSAAPGQGQYNGAGYWHQTGPAEAPDRTSSAGKRTL